MQSELPSVSVACTSSSTVAGAMVQVSNPANDVPVATDPIDPDIAAQQVRIAKNIMERCRVAALLLPVLRNIHRNICYNSLRLSSEFRSYFCCLLSSIPLGASAVSS